MRKMLPLLPTDAADALLSSVAVVMAVAVVTLVVVS